MIKKRTHILVLRLSALGDVAMTLPVVYSAAAAYPDVRFTVVTRPFFARLFINRPENVDVYPVDPKSYSGVTGVARLAGELGHLWPTAVADLHNVLRTWLIDSCFRMKGVKVAMVDKGRAGRRAALRSGSVQESFINRYVEVFSRLGLYFDLTFKSLIPADMPAPVDVGQPAVGIAPFARYFTKTYPPELMRRVVESLCAHGINVYLFGGRGREAEELKVWADAIDGCHSVAGEFAIEDELVLMSKMQVMVSMDSANQHLASLVGTRVVTIWGATIPECGFTPYGQDAAYSIIEHVECQPCSVAGTAQCPKSDFRCMRGVSPEKVVARIMAVTELK